jgi:pimeloyl-ACP methyl ester carboxylesterase
MRAMLGSDLLFWAALKLAPDTMIATMLATDPALVHAASAEEKARVAAILEGIFPVSRRSRGLLNDAVLAGNPAEADLSRIACPTLAVSVEDDRFGTADAARHLARSVPDARLVIYPSGGHVWVGHHAELFAEVATFLDAIARRA